MSAHPLPRSRTWPTTAIKVMLVGGHALSAGIALVMLPTLAGGLVAIGIALSFLHQARRGFGVHESDANVTPRAGRVLAPWLVILRQGPHEEGAVLAVRPSCADGLRRVRSALRWPDPRESTSEKAGK